MTGETYNPAFGTIIATSQYIQEGVTWLNETDIGAALQTLGFAYASYRMITKNGPVTIKNRTKLNELKPNEIVKLSLEDLRKSIPGDWKIYENNGRVHIKDINGRMRVRIDPPDKITNYQHMHIYDEFGNPLDELGNIVDRSSPEGHLPWNDK